MKSAAFLRVLLFVLALIPGMAGAAPPINDNHLDSLIVNNPWGGGIDLSLGSMYVGGFGRDLRRYLDQGATNPNWTIYPNSLAGFGPAVSAPGTIDAIELAGYTVYTVAVMPFSLLRGKAGLLYHEVTLAGPCTSLTSCDLQEGFSTSSIFGFGAAYNLGKNINILGGYTIVESDLSRLAIGLNFSFE